MPHANLHRMINLVKVTNTIVVSYVNCGYAMFIENFVQHARRAGVDNYLLIAEDGVTYEHLQARFPGRAVPHTWLLDTAHPMPSHASTYGSKDFQRICCARPMYLQALLLYRVNVIYSDVDSVFLKSPLPYIPLAYDYVGVDDYAFPMDTDPRYSFGQPAVGHTAYEWPHLALHPSASNYLCACFMFLRPSRATLALMHRWHSACIIDPRNVNQWALNAAIATPLSAR